MVQSILSWLGVMLCWLALVEAALAQVPRFREDAALHAIQFVDDKEGWAVGDEGVIWHTIDGGQHWELQESASRASLRSVYFHNPFVGWIVGREELSQGMGSVGVVLYTRDGGLKWQRLLGNSLPGLNRVRFCDARTGFLIGDGADQLPSGVFRTTDGGQSWKPLPGPRSTSWLDGDFENAEAGALTGAWSRLAALKQGAFETADVDDLGGRSVRGLRLMENKAIAVGDGGLILSSVTRGKRWGYLQPKLPVEVLASWNFHAVDSFGERLWVCGRPGSTILHSPDRGSTWRLQRTGHPLPLNGLFFVDEQQGWAVGELGTILHTHDGGQNWKAQRQGGQRVALLCVHGRPEKILADLVAHCGAVEGYLSAALCLLGPDPGTAAAQQATSSQRVAFGLRAAGGAAGERLWQFPLPQHLNDASKQQLLEEWKKLHGPNVERELLRQLVLALRIWRPDVLVTEAPDSPTQRDALVAEALQAACTQAADSGAFPEQIQQLGLAVWKVSKVYATSANQAQVTLDGTEVQPRLRGSLRDFAAPALGVLQDVRIPAPAARHFRLLSSTLSGAGLQRGLLDGINAPAGVARRALPSEPKLPAATLQALRTRRTLEAALETPNSPLAKPDQVLSQMGKLLEELPPDQGAVVALGIANQYAQRGQWALAQEAYLLMLERFPAHPLAVEACRWLVRHNTSSEARRRHELQHFVATQQSSLAPPVIRGEHVVPAAPVAPGTSPGLFTIRKPQNPPGPLPSNLTGEQPNKDGKPRLDIQPPEVVRNTRVTYLTNQAELRQWYQGALASGKHLVGLGPLYAEDPGLQLCLQAARRHLGAFQEAADWFGSAEARTVQGALREVIAGENWIISRTGPPPRPVLLCRQVSSRPHLDGKFEDACWNGVPGVVLKNAINQTSKDHETEVRLAFDHEYLYLALRCQQPPAAHVPPAQTRPRDADLRQFDRVSLLLDLDRDYATCFHLQVDQRGCVCEDCWGDRTWNPKWFVAVRSTPTAWYIEAAIPLLELTGQQVPVGALWAANVVRILPRRGVQAVSLPADVEPRTEGLGLLMFQGEPARNPVQPVGAVQMPRVP